MTVDNLETMPKIHSYYITNSKSELANYGKDRTTEEICATLKDARRHIEEYEIDEYNEEKMAEIITCLFTVGPLCTDTNVLGKYIGTSKLSLYKAHCES